MFYLIGSCKWFEGKNIMKFLLNRNSVVEKSFESLIQSNWRRTVTLRKWPDDRYIQGDLYIQVNFVENIRQLEMLGSFLVTIIYRLTTYIECFHLRGQHLCKFIGTKESICIRKEFNSQRIGLRHQHGRRDVM